MTFLQFIALWSVGSLALGLVVGPIIHWGLNDEVDDGTVGLNNYQRKPNQL